MRARESRVAIDRNRANVFFGRDADAKITRAQSVARIDPFAPIPFASSRAR